MAVGHKFYIFGGGRWREVCTATGRVEGWGRARFVSLRRKRLRLVRRRPLLRALRDLAAGRPTAVRDGPRLSQKRYLSPVANKSKKIEESVCRHHHCCQRSNNNGCTHIECKTSQLSKVSASTQSECRADAGIQTESSQTHTLSFPITLNKRNNSQTVKNDVNKRTFTNNKKNDRRDSTSSEEILQTKITTTATVHVNNEQERYKHRKRKRKRSQSDSSVEDKPHPVLRIPSKQKLSLKRKRSPSSSDENLSMTKKRQQGKRLPVHRAGEYRKKTRINPDDEIVMSSTHNISAERLRSKCHRISNLMKPQSSSTPAVRKRAESNSSDVIISPQKTARLRSQTSQSKNYEKRKSSNHDNQSTDSPESSSENEVLISKLKSHKYKPGPKSSKIDLKKNLRQNKDKISSKRRVKGNKSFERQKTVSSRRKIVPSKPQRQDKFKEVIIEESDVEVLRQYLIKHAPDFELLKFDEDDDYKKIYFFKINPLVNVERCPKIARMLRDGSQETLSLKDFASQLGLKSVSEISKPKRYKMRKANEKYYGTVSSETDTSMDKENVSVAANNTRSHKDVSKNLSSNSRNTKRILKSPKQVSKNIPERPKKILKEPQNATNDAVDTSTDSEHEVFHNKENRSHKDVSKNLSSDSRNTKRSLKSKEVSRNIPVRPKKILKEPQNASIDAVDTSTDSEHDIVQNKGNDLQNSIEDIKKAASKPRHIISKRPSSSLSKEYSNLEDHAVVSWVSVGGRARQVNGNRLWKELEEQYIRLTGIRRTWHSLRNRYLRYILPALGTLALPPTHVARLRAAAATGELKSHKRSPRRNSIFALPPRGALSRRPPRAAPPTPAPASENAESDSSSDSEPKAKRSKYEENKPSPKRSLRSSLPPSPPSPPPQRRRSLRYSEITRQFAARHRADNTSTDSAKESPSKRQDKQSDQSPRGRSRRLFNPGTVS